MIDVRDLERLARELPADRLPDLIGDLERAKAVAWARLATPTPTRTEPEPLLTAEELAPLVSLPVHAVRDRARRGIIPSISLGHFRRFKLSSVIEALEAGEGNGHRITDPVPAEKRRAGKGRCPRGVHVEQAEKAPEVFRE
jgi:hypothetical protein